MIRRKMLSLCMALCMGLTLMLFAGHAILASGSPDPGDPDLFFLIKRTIRMQEGALEVPVPNYELVDVEGDIKDPPEECPNGLGTVIQVATVSGDDCLLRPQITFTDGYMDTVGTVVTPNATFYNGKHGGETVVFGHVGDIVQLTVKNEMPEAVDGIALETGFFAPADNLQLVHWHGMELDNESDGTPVTEFGIDPGDERLYQYRLYRPGPYWFHPHIRPLLTESRGQIGQLIIRSWEEEVLTLHGVLPLIYKAVTLSDSTVANETNRFAYRNGMAFDNFTDQEVDNNLMPNIAADITGDGVCNRAERTGDCVVPEGELVFVNGVVPTGDHDIPTVYIPKGRAARVAFINSSNERFYRFRLLLDGEAPPGAGDIPVPQERVNRGTTGQCYADGSTEQFTGSDPLSCDQGLPLFRVGGQNGLLDHVRLEGQNEIPPVVPPDTFEPRDFDTVIRKGEDFIGVAERTEFIVLTKDRNGQPLNVGEQMFIWTIDYPHGVWASGFDNNFVGDGDTNNRDIQPRKLVRIKIVPNLLGLPAYDIEEGDPIMAHSLVNRPTENIKIEPLSSLSPVPPVNDPFLGTPFEGTTNPHIVLGNRVAPVPPEFPMERRFPAINGNKGAYSGINAIATQIPTQKSVRYARIGDVIEWVYANDTGNAHHPFHMHGFSFQPVSIHNFVPMDSNGDGTDDTVQLVDPPVFTFDYNEFVDVEVMQPDKALKYRMKMNDRFKIPDDTKFNYFQLLAKFPYDQSAPYGGAGDLGHLTDAEMGGGVGRWLFHCHILHHAFLGMIADLCIAPAEDADASGCKIFVDPNITSPSN